MSRDIVNAGFQDRKIDLIFRMYVDTADQDYISSRFSYNNGLFHNFYWCASQACEKYLKAFLLMQDHGTVGYGHKLCDLFDDAVRYDTDNILPKTLTLPETTAMGRDAWHGKEISLFVDYLETFGSPDNRYAIQGTFVNGPVMHALDLLCYYLRKLIRNKNFLGEDLFFYRSKGIAFYKKIADPQDWMIDPTLLLEMMFVGIYPVGTTKLTRSIFANMNFAFFSERDASEKGFGGQYFLGSPLHNHLVRLGELEEANMISGQNLDVVRQLREWAETHIQMSPKLKEALGLPRRQR